MKKKRELQEVWSAVPMHALGISVVVLTEHKRLEETRSEFLQKPDSIWMGGRGKNHMRNYLDVALRAQDKYFDQNPLEAVSENQRWNDFLDDCVIYAVLCSVLDDEPLALLHPSVWNEQYAGRPSLRNASAKATLIPGVPVQYCPVTEVMKENSDA